MKRMVIQSLTQIRNVPMQIESVDVNLEIIPLVYHRILMQDLLNDG